MASTGILNGTLLLLYVDGVAIGGTTSHSRAQSVAMRDSNTKSSGGNEEVLPGLWSGSYSFDGFVAYDHTYGYEDLDILCRAKTKVVLKFGTEVVGDPRWTCDAYLESLDDDNSNAENVGYSGTFHITGGITRVIVT